MERLERVEWGIGFLWLVLAVLPQTGALAEEGSWYARVRYLEGGLEISQLREQEVRSATLNSALIAGDRARTSVEGRAEIQFRDGSVFRMDHGTRLDIQSLGAPDQDPPEAAVLRLWNGSLFLEMVRGPGSPERYRIDTPLASIYLMMEGVYRIDAPTSGDLVVSSFSGTAEVAGERNSVLLSSGQRTVVPPGGDPLPPVSFNTARRDDFARWNEERQVAYLRPAPSGEGVQPEEEELPVEVVPYLAELNLYGGWYSVPVYGWVWRPFRLAVSWRPYSVGYWVYYPAGWTWVSWEPWGWYPYHYGRWHWVTGIGWAWVPGRVYSGAWVSWAYGANYIGWCPLNFYDQPAFFGLHLSAYDRRGWVFVRYSHFRAQDLNSRFVSPRLVQKVERLVRTRRNPRFRPRDLDSSGVGPRLVEEMKRTGGSPRGSVPATLLRSFRETNPAENPVRWRRSGSRRDRFRPSPSERISRAPRFRRPGPGGRPQEGTPRRDGGVPSASPRGGRERGEPRALPQRKNPQDPSGGVLRRIIERIRRPSVRRGDRPEEGAPSPRTAAPRGGEKHPQLRPGQRKPSVTGRRGGAPGRRFSRPPGKSQPRARPGRRGKPPSRSRPKRN